MEFGFSGDWGFGRVPQKTIQLLFMVRVEACKFRNWSLEFLKPEGVGVGGQGARFVDLAPVT